MRSYILITGTTLALSAGPALAGGAPRPSHGLFAGGTHNSVQRAGNSLSGCLCGTAGAALKNVRGGAIGTIPHGGAGAVARMPKTGNGARMLVNSVIGLNGVRVGQSASHGGGQAIGLAGSVDGTAPLGGANGKAHLGVGLAGSVKGTGTRVAGAATHGRSLLNVSLANANGGKAGRIANVAVLNRTGTDGRSAVNVAVLNGSGGTSGRVANVSVLNRTGTAGRSAVNVAALNGSGGTSGRVANVSVLNRTGTAGHSAVNVAALNGRGGAGGSGQVGGFRIINGIPCLPDGTPLTGAAAKAVLAAMNSTPQAASPTAGNGRARHSRQVRADSQEPSRRGRWADSIPDTGSPSR